MRILVYGAGVLGSLHSALLQEAGHDVVLVARGARLASVREHGVQLAEGASPSIRSVMVPVVERPDGRYDLILVFVRTHQVDGILESLAGVEGDVLFLLNWAAGPQPLSAALGRERILLGFPARGGTMDGDVVRYRADSLLTRGVAMSIGEVDGARTPRLDRTLAMFRSAGFRARNEPRMDAWLKTHAAFEQPLGQAVHAAGGLDALASDRGAIRAMIAHMRRSFDGLPTPLVPGAFGLLRVLPVPVLVAVFRRFLRSTAAGPLATDTPAVTGELERLAEQLRASSKTRES